MGTNTYIYIYYTNNDGVFTEKVPMNMEHDDEAPEFGAPSNKA